MALEACVMFEFDARQVKVVSTSFLWTTPTARDEVTVVPESKSPIHPRLVPPPPSRLPGDLARPLPVSEMTRPSGAGIPLIHQYRAGRGVPAKVDKEK